MAIAGRVNEKDFSDQRPCGTGLEADGHGGATLRGRHRMPIGARLPPFDQGVGRYVGFFNRLLWHDLTHQGERLGMVHAHRMSACDGECLDGLGGALIGRRTNL